VVSFCAKTNSDTFFWDKTNDSVKSEDTTKILLATAKMDKEFFNELVVSFLQSKEEWMLNKTLNQLDDRKRYFKCLSDFTKKYEKMSYLTDLTLERVGDNLCHHHESLRLYKKSDSETPQLAHYFYEQALQQTELSTECRERIQDKLMMLQYSEVRYIN
jgi:hypothetical protein